MKKWIDNHTKNIDNNGHDLIENEIDKINHTRDNLNNNSGDGLDDVLEINSQIEIETNDQKEIISNNNTTKDDLSFLDSNHTPLELITNGFIEKGNAAVQNESDHFDLNDNLDIDYNEDDVIQKHKEKIAILDS